MGAKGLTTEQNDRVRGLIRQLLQGEGENQVLLAKKLGVTQSAISSMLSGRQGTTYVVVERIAKLMNMPEHEVLGKTAPATTRRPRELAAELAREHGVNEAAILSVLSEPVAAEAEHKSTLWWADRIRWRERELLESRPADQDERLAAAESSGTRARRRQLR